MYAAARLVFSSLKYMYHHITTLLRRSAPLAEEFGAGCFCVCSARVQVSSRVCICMHYWGDVQTRQRLRSSSSITYLLQVVSRTRLSTASDRAFPVAVACVWNSLAHFVTYAPSVGLAVFRSKVSKLTCSTFLPFPLVTTEDCTVRSCLLTYLPAILWYDSAKRRWRTHWVFCVYTTLIKKRSLREMIR